MEETLVKEKAFLTATEVSRIINLGRTKTYEAIRAGRIPTVVIEGCLRVPVTALRDWIAERSGSGNAPVPEPHEPPTNKAAGIKPDVPPKRSRTR